MNVFVVRLNPDPRDNIAIAYSTYPTDKEYEHIYASSTMDGFHEAVNFLSESGQVRGYLPPRHLPEIKVCRNFCLVSITASSARKNGGAIVGIQAGCRYVGENKRISEKLKNTQLTYYYTCPSDLSMIFDKPLMYGRSYLLSKNQKWIRHPMIKIDKRRINTIIDAAIKEGALRESNYKINKIKSWLNGNNTIQTEQEANLNFKKTVDDLLSKGKKIPKPKGSKNPDQQEIVSFQYKRGPKVAAYVLKKANGKCEDCQSDAPFLTKNKKRPYLEVHHVISLKDCGEDTVKNVVALCPNCHRKRHYG